MPYHWRTALDDAITKNGHDAHSRFLQLATLDESGHPANRTVVFRGFLGEELLTMVTDGRSAKARQIRLNPVAEACWYFTSSLEQFRIRGRLAVADGRSALSDARKRAWSRLSDATREQFYWRTPGMPLDSGEVPAIDDDGLPESFLLLTLTPEHVNHLRLATTPHSRMISTRSGTGWNAEIVNP